MASSIQTEYRIVVVGKTGNGKSSVGNSLFGKRVFAAKLSPDSTTQKCECFSASLPDNNTTLAIIDTPGVFDTGRPQEDVLDEIVKCIALAAPGPHVFLFVLRISRYTNEEQDSFDILESLFGEEVMKYAIVVFTGTDQLGMDGDGINTIDDFLRENKSNDLKQLLRKCGNRYVGISNLPGHPKMKEGVNALLSKIRQLVASNGNWYFQQMCFKRAEEVLQKKAQEQRRLFPERSEREIRQQFRDEIVGAVPRKTGVWESIKPVIGALVTGVIGVIGVVATRACTVS